MENLKQCKKCKQVKELSKFKPKNITCRRCLRIKYNETVRINKPELQILVSAKARAKKYGREYCLTPEDIIIPLFCPYLGIKLQMGTGQPTKASPALDRIDNEKGYVRGNIEIISNAANALKGNLSKSQLRQFALALLRRLPE